MFRRPTAHAKFHYLVLLFQITSCVLRRRGCSSRPTTPPSPSGAAPLAGGPKSTLIHKILDIRTNCFKIFCNVKIRVTQHRYTQGVQKFRPFEVIFHNGLVTMLPSIHLDCQFEGSAVEIHDEITDDTLPIKFHGKAPQEFVPQTSFLRSHLPAQQSCMP